jgi:tetratricopeptide (TPR) repeat protein/transcriptional regulator with XRE-family HTH domain
MSTSNLPYSSNRIRQERIARNWRQRDLADHLETTVLTINRWERGVQSPSAYFRVKLCAIFGKSAEELGFLAASGAAPDTTEVKGDTLVEPPSAVAGFPDLWSVPYSRNPFFLGREEILSHLHVQLRREYTMALTQSWAVTGLGGIGKTQIALEYAYQYRQDYHSVFWTSAASRETLLAGIVTIADLLQLPERNEQDQRKVFQAVKHWFASHQKWLWILDNADDRAVVDDIAPAERSGHLLFTSRAQAWGSLAQAIEVETLGMAEGVLFLLRRAKLLAPDAFLDQAPEDHLAAAEAIVLEMDFLPLALDQAGAYIEEVGCSLSSYLELYRAHRQALLQYRGHGASDHSEAVGTTLALSFQKVEEVNRAAADLLRLCAFLEPDAIPEELISEGGVYAGSALGDVATDGLRLNNAIEVLRRFSLVHRNAETRVLRIHRLVQVVIKDAMKEEERKQWAGSVVQAVNVAFPRQIRIETWSNCRRYLSQAQVCSVLMRDYAIVSPEAASLLSRTASYLETFALYEQAESLEQQALDIREQVLRPDDLDMAVSFDNLGFLSYEQGKYEQAEPLFQKAISIQEQALGPDHPDITIALRHLAFLYLMLEKFEQAEALLQRVVSIRERVLGPEHHYTGNALNNLAIVSHEQGKYEQAEALFRKGIHIQEQAVGPDHPDVANTLNNLGLVSYEQGKYEQAEAFFQRALRIWEQVVEPDDTIIAHVLSGLANVYRAQGEYEQAELLYQRALSLRVKNRPQHADTADTLHDFAVLREMQGNFQEAVSLYQRALAIREQVLRPQHVKTKKTRASLHALLESGAGSIPDH